MQANAGGDAADYFDFLCLYYPDVLKRIILARLDKMYDDFNEDMLLEFACTRWSQSESFRGAWFQFGPRATPGDYEELFKRQGNLFFSGEAVCRRYYGFYHGALLAGWRDANIVLELINASGLYDTPFEVVHEDRCEALPENNGNAVPRSRRFRG